MWYLYLIPFILGVLFLGVSIILNMVVKKMNNKYSDVRSRCTARTTATVMGYKSERLMHSKNTRYIYLLLSYCGTVTPYTISVNPRKFPIDTKLDIIYNPDNLLECIVIGVETDSTIKTLKLMSAMYLGASILCAAIGVVVL